MRRRSTVKRECDDGRKKERQQTDRHRSALIGAKAEIGPAAAHFAPERRDNLRRLEYRRRLLNRRARI